MLDKRLVVLLGGFGILGFPVQVYPADDMNGCHEFGQGVRMAVDSEAAELAATWNRAVLLAKEEKWNELWTYLGINGQVNENDGDSGIAPLEESKTLSRMVLSHPIDADHSMLRGYVTTEGDLLGLVQLPGRHIFNERYDVKLMRPFSLQLGRIERRRGQPPRFHLLGADDIPFGLGMPVNGVRLKATPSEQTVESWQEVNLEVSLEYISKEGGVLTGGPCSEWGATIFLGLLDAQPAEMSSVFADWLSSTRFAADRPTSSLLAQLDWVAQGKDLQQVSKGANLRWAVTIPQTGDSPSEPIGTFRIFVVYHPYRQWVRYPEDRSFWNHRVASQPVQVTVTGHHPETKAAKER